MLLNLKFICIESVNKLKDQIEVIIGILGIKTVPGPEYINIEDNKTSYSL